MNAVEKNIILAVDDEPKNIKILEYLFSEKYTLKVAKDGREALDQVKTFVPSIILLDIMMPEIDGYEVCKKIKSDMRFKFTKILLVSGKAMLEERLKGYDVGADDFVSKPFDPEELEAKVKVFLELHDLQQKLSIMNISLEDEVRVRTEQALKSERMAFIGMHSAEIVHNLRNPLTVLLGNLGVIKRKYPDEKRCDDVVKAAKRIQDIITMILNSVRTSYENEKKEMNINIVLQEELDFLKIDDFFKLKVTADVQFDDLPKFRAVTSHMSQIFGNLIKNAVEAMVDAETKKLTIKTFTESSKIYVQISDTGYGISTENLEKVFQPMFTTKNQKNDEKGSSLGTGLGLPSCKKMIEAYGGAISVESKVGKGTTFIVEFPLSESEVLGAA